MTIEFGRETCGYLEQAEAKEWWLANGRGGYAAGTIAGSLTRRYHGLLIAPLHPPLGRTLVVAKTDATLIYGDQEVPLFTNRWHGGVVDPMGHVHIESFLLEGRMPVWHYAVGDIRIEARLWLEQRANTAYIAYRMEPSHVGRKEGIRLKARVLINGRDHHGQTHRGEPAPVVMKEHDLLRIAHPNWFTLSIKAQGGSIEEQSYWIENFDLPIERERGLPDRDNHFCVCHARLDLKPGTWSGLIFSLNEETASGIEDAMTRFHEHDAGVLHLSRTRVPEMVKSPDWIRQLILAADSFIFSRPLPGLPEGESVIAGYPWFGDWGRDTMISLPGLTLATGRHETARRILMTFARYVNQGMLPNVFPEGGETPQYNTVDASLWYIEAWKSYVETTDDQAALREAFPVLQEIMEWYRKGTRYDIHMDPDDSLLYAGEPGAQITWMDAKVGDWVVTPRIGKPVEINALWYHAHRVMADFARLLGVSGERYAQTAQKIEQSFRRFKDKETGGLYDVIDGPGGDDNSIRPNQIFAVSLAYSPLDSESQRDVVSLCKQHLFCSFGLRSLAPSHRDYRPYYQGGVWERDGSYHQGPVWAWLLGHYALAEYRVHGDASAAQALLESVRYHLLEAGLGTVSEIFDGAP
ncbi:MAG: amylo-alpha-1,6-glucosidase, partial [bacterium]